MVYIGSSGTFKKVHWDGHYSGLFILIAWNIATGAWKHFEKQDGTPFTSEIAGIDVPVWEEKAGKA